MPAQSPSEGMPYVSENWQSGQVCRRACCGITKSRAWWCRLDNGYRVYDEHLLDRVQKIRGLIDAGIPTRIISDILPCLDQPQRIVVADPDPELRELLMRERARMSQKIDLLIHNRDALTRYIEALDTAATRSQKLRAG